MEFVKILSLLFFLSSSILISQCKKIDDDVAVIDDIFEKFIKQIQDVSNERDLSEHENNLKYIEYKANPINHIENSKNEFNLNKNSSKLDFEEEQATYKSTNILTKIGILITINVKETKSTIQSKLA